MDPDTAIGGAARGVGGFPPTRRSAVLAVSSADAAERDWAFETLIAQYWKPVYKYLRLRFRLPNEDAKDLTQGFFARAIEQGTFASFDPARGSFRTFLRACLDRWVADERKAASRQKRGGGAVLVALDFHDAEGEIRELALPDGVTPDEYFQREWVRGFFALAVVALRDELATEGKDAWFTIFERYDLDPPAEGRPTYRALADELGLKPTDVTNHLAAVRRRFRRRVLDMLRESTASDAEFEAEARALLGTEP